MLPLYGAAYRVYCMHAARSKCTMQKFAVWAPSQNFVMLYLRKGTYRQLEKNVKHQYLPHMSSQYGELRPND